MYAEHILGLTAAESGAVTNPARLSAAIESVRQRFEAIRRDGYLRPRGRKKQVTLNEHGSVFDLDILAGDGQYVFLSLGARYRELREPELCYGFAFDAAALILAGALVGPDLVHDYDALADEIAREVDATLPPLPMVSDEEIAEFGRLFGEDDPEMLAFVQAESVSRYHDILDAMRSQDTSVEGAAGAIRLFRERAATLQVRERRSGQEALALVAGGGQLEILVRGRLPLALSIATIEAGQLFTI